MRIQRRSCMKQFLQYLKTSVYVVFTGLTLSSAMATDVQEEMAGPSSLANLKSIKRSIIWSEQPDLTSTQETGLTAEFGQFNGAALKVNAPFRIAFADLILSIVAGDGELSSAEEESLNGRLTNEGNFMEASEFEKVKNYYSDAFNRAKGGYYKGIDLSAIVKKCEEEMNGLGYQENYKSHLAKAALFTAILAAKADGFAAEEEAAARQISEQLGVSKDVFDAIDTYCSLLTEYNRNPQLSSDSSFKQKVLALAERTGSLFR